MIPEVTMLPSGAKLGMQIASWRVVGQLKRVFALEMRAVDMNVSDPFVRSLMTAALSGNKMAVLKSIGGEDLDTFKNLFFQFLGSATFEAALYDCMLSCTRNGIKIAPEIFEAEDAREDYLLIAWEVLKLNLRPFLKSLASTSSSLTPPDTGSPR